MWPDILYAVHSCARFSISPNKLIHEQAVTKRICRYYLKGTKDKGIILLNPDESRGIECYVDTSFDGDYDKDRADDAASMLLSPWARYYC
jgi:hypothetical protein